jgi:hypothetical protein
MKKTAVELIEEYLKFKGIIIDDKTTPQVLVGIINQAKEMEQEQSIDFARLCLNKAKDLDILTAFMNTQQYYNETFKNTEQ